MKPKTQPDCGKNTMRLARVIILLGLLVSVGLIVLHVFNLPVYSSRGWFSPRVEKQAYFSITDEPFDNESWSSRWGMNRPQDYRPHAILSEVEVRVKHQSRSSLVEISVVGDSVDEVDAFIRTLRSDVMRTYSNGQMLAPDHGYYHGEWDDSESTFFWRQCYLWVLIANAIVFFTLWLSVRRKKNQTAEEGADQPPTRSQFE